MYFSRKDGQPCGQVSWCRGKREEETDWVKNVVVLHIYKHLRYTSRVKLFQLFEVSDNACHNYVDPATDYIRMAEFEQEKLIEY